MRRTLAPLLVLVLLSACGSDPSTVAEPSQAASPAASPDASAVPIEGLVAEPEDPSHEHKEGPLEYDRLPPSADRTTPAGWPVTSTTRRFPLEVAVHSARARRRSGSAQRPGPAGRPGPHAAELAEKNPEYVLVAPLRGMDSKVVAVTWGVSLEASSADDPRLEEFLEA
jgi:hypothetical protein